MTADAGTEATGGGPRDALSGFDQSVEYALRRSPDVTTITPGAQIEYTCRWIGRGGQPQVATNGYWGPRDGVHWYRYSARPPRHFWQNQLESMAAGFTWRHTWNDDPGFYSVIALVRSRSTPDALPTRCSVSQQVGDTGAILAESFEQLLRRGETPSLDAVAAQASKYLGVLEQLERRTPITDPRKKQEHDRTVEAWRSYLARLADLKRKTDGLRCIPVRALHLETATQARRPLFLFLVDQGEVQHLQPRAGVITHQKWTLVDWTNVEDPRFRGWFEGEGATDGQAVTAALASWDWSNRYPAGHVTYDLPAELRDLVDGPDQRRLDTNGTNLTEEIVAVLGWVAVGAMVVSGVCALFVAVPALASGALAAALVSSTGGAVLSIAERRRQGIFDWRADVIDGLTVVGNLAGAGAWARGARVLGLDAAGRKVEYVFVGARVAADVVQGLLVVDQHVDGLTALAEDPDLLPDERAREMLKVIAGLTAAGLLTYLSVGAGGGRGGREAGGEHLDARTLHVGESAAASATQLKTVRERLEAIVDAHAHLDLTAPPIVEGHTGIAQERGGGRGGRGRQAPGQHRTTARVAEPAQRAPVAPKDTEFARTHYSAESHDWQVRKFGKRSIELKDRDGFLFEAHCDDGTLGITIYRRYDPATDHDLAPAFPGVRELIKSKVIFGEQIIDRMYKYFEDVGNPVRRLQGLWAWGNYRVARKEFDLQIRNGLSEDAAAAMAVRKSVTYPIHAKHGFTKIVRAKHRTGRFVNSSGELEEFGVFEFLIEKAR